MSTLEEELRRREEFYANMGPKKQRKVQKQKIAQQEPSDPTEALITRYKQMKSLSTQLYVIHTYLDQIVSGPGYQNFLSVFKRYPDTIVLTGWDFYNDVMYVYRRDYLPTIRRANSK